MSWTQHPSGRKARLPRDWPQLRIRVLRRDRYACQWRGEDGRRCLAPANQVDHIERGDDHSLSNLQALCAFHHRHKTGREGAEARGPRPTTRREPERHPGLRPG